MLAEEYISLHCRLKFFLFSLYPSILLTKYTIVFFRSSISLYSYNLPNFTSFINSIFEPKLAAITGIPDIKYSTVVRPNASYLVQLNPTS